MQLPSKPVWLLIGVHTLCLCIGAFFLYQLVASLTEHQASHETWEQLESQSGELAEFARTVEASDLASDSQTQTQLVALARDLAGHHSALMLVSRDGSILQEPAATSTNWNIGDRVNWQADQSSGHMPGARRGWVETSTGRRVAISNVLADGTASLVVYDAQGTTPAWRQGVLSSLPMAAGIAFLWTWILSSVATVILSARANFDVSVKQSQIEHDAIRSAQDLLRTRDAVIFGLAKLAESRDPETGQHLERISSYSTRLANALRALPKYNHAITPTFVRLLGISSVLHDIGKVGLEDMVLLKPGRLNEEERKKMQEHTLVAGACLKEIEQRLGASNFLQTAREIAVHHHERWDGNGYPAGLAGDAIPLAARIVTVADVYDALSSKRVYKDAFPHEECVRLIREGAGTQFDPDLVEVFLTIESDFAAISQKYSVTHGHTTNSEPRENTLMTPSQETILRSVVANENTSSESSQRSSFVA